MTESDQLDDGTYREGTTIVDCGDKGTIKEVHHDHDQIVYDIEFENGWPLELSETELEIGIVDGTIKVVP